MTPHSKGVVMIVMVARIEAHSPLCMTRVEVQRSLFGGAPVTRVIWELPGPRETSWLVQVPEALAADQLRRFAHLRITADVVGFRSVEFPDTNEDDGTGTEPRLPLWRLRPAS
jgi:hypothetical protein